jgi:glycine/D-amino acid oxidase-like deaminating enzyme/nitrite reductase/ring-hydroxylating ferredoxin subunit
MLLVMIVNNETLSYWNKTAERKIYDSLNSDIETDTLIIGGGITGVSAAYHLGQAGVKTILIESARLCSGTTGSTTGKVTVQHGILYSKLLKTFGQDTAKMYLEANQLAVQFVKKIVKTNKIDCNLEVNTANIFASSEKQAELVEKEYETAKLLGIDAEYTKNADFPPHNYAMTGFKDQFVLHSVRYIEGLAKLAVLTGVEIFENSKAIKIVDKSSDTDDGNIYCTLENQKVIKAKHVVLATQFPIYEGMGAYFTRLYPKRSYGISVAHEKPCPFTSSNCYISADGPERSIRTHLENGRRVLIVVGEGHTTSRSDDDMQTHFKTLESYAHQLIGDYEPIAKWSAQDYKTPDDMPYIGRVTKGSPVFVGTGYGKWGLSLGTLAGMMISDMIVNGKSDYEELFNPSRGDIAASSGTFAKEVTGQVKELISSVFKRTDFAPDLKSGEASIINFEGKKAGAYIDEDNVLTILDITCTHLGCKLGWNSAEKTWDCPCHGGRFAPDGRLLEGPPKNPLNVLYKEKQ